ncbi:MAG: alpha/beta fold hydrolase [Pseudomonadota bacterium]
MLDATYSFLSSDYSGLIIAIVLLGAGVLIARSAKHILPKLVGRGVALIAIVLAVGALTHIYRVSQIDKRFPAPGAMVDVGGYEIHILAEGPEKGPALVWFAGGHIGGLGFYQHHAAMRDNVRSILIDRPGTGWSDAGPFPRTTARQAEEVIEVLKRSGEEGPFIFVGHSFGGLLAINIGRRWPEKTAAVVMMDATPPDVVMYGLDKEGLRSFAKSGWRMTLKHVFGLYRSVDPVDADGNDDVNFTNPMNVMMYRWTQARYGVAASSAFEELTPEGFEDRAFDTIVIDGELGDIPLYLVAPKDADPQTVPYAQMVAGGPGPKAERFTAFLKSTREKYLNASSNSTRVVAPDGTGHNFIYEDIPFTVETMQRVVDDVKSARAEYQRLTTNWPGPYGGVPPVDEATPESMERAFNQAIREKRGEINAIVANMEPATFENTILPLEASGLALARIQQLFGIFSATATNPDIAAVQGRVAPQIAALADETAHNVELFSRVADVFEALPDSAPDAAGQRLVEVHYEDMRRRGAALSDVEKARLKSLNADLASQVTKFGQNANKDEAQLVVFLNSASRLEGLPAAQIAAAKAAAETREQPDKWAIPISRPYVWPLLTNVHDRALREEVWRKWVTRGGNDGELDNGPVMTEILRLRGEKAKLLGYDNFAAYQTSARMVRTPDVAMKMMMDTWEALLEPTNQAIADMQAIADSEGADFALQPWDKLYYEAKLKAARYNFDAQEMLPYFALDNIVEAMLWTAGQVFDFEFQELTDIPTVDTDIRVFEVQRDEVVVGVIWMDLFSRPGKGPASWAVEYRTAEDFRGRQLPLVAMHSAAQKPLDGGPVLVDWPRANVIFHEFGHTMQTLSNATDYPSLGALHVPWDFIEVPALLHERWMMTDEVVDRFLVHHETGESMPADLRQSMLDSLNYDRVFSATLNFLGGAIVDMRLHLLADGREIDAEAVEAEVIAELEMPQAIDLILYVPHAFHTFNPHYAAGVYTYLWSDVLAANAAEVFQESPGGFYDKDVAKRWRETVFDIGNSRPVDETFRTFIGGDPDPWAFLRRFGIEPHSEAQ